MSKRSKRAGFAGVTKLRKTLRRLEPEITSGIREVVRRGANAILYDAINNARRVDYGLEPGILDTGAMIDSMSIKYSTDGFTALIGPEAQSIKNLANVKTKLLKSGRESKISLNSKRARWNAMKGYWAETGTKGDPSLNIPPIERKPFMAPAFDANKAWIARDARKEINIVLSSVVSTTTDE